MPAPSGNSPRLTDRQVRELERRLVPARLARGRRSLVRPRPRREHPGRGRRRAGAGDPEPRGGAPLVRRRPGPGGERRRGRRADPRGGGAPLVGARALRRHPEQRGRRKKADGVAAGLVVDECGLKGLRVGDAQFSELHANFIVNLGHATARDVLALIETVQRAALERFGVRLETEPQLVGEF